MASSIVLSDNGVTSGSAGLKETGGNDGVLLLQTTTAGGVATTAVTVDNAQNVGVGVTPSAWTASYKGLDIGSVGGIASNSASFTSYNNFYSGTNSTYKTTGFATAYRQGQDNGQHAWFVAPSGTAGTTVTFTQAMTLDASGNLGVGTTSPGQRLSLDSSSTNATSINILNTAGASGNFNIGVTGSSSTWGSAGGLAFRDSAAGATRMFIDSSGNLLVGTTSATNKRVASFVGNSVSTTVYYAESGSSYTGGHFVAASATAASTGWYHFVGQSSGGTNNILIYGNGNIQNANNSYGAISDVKLKENIIDTTPKLEKLCQVRVVNYNLKGDYEQHKQIGVVAQELEQVFPGMVDETADKDMEGNDLGTTTKSVKYSVFVPMLIKAIQEQQALITSLTERITALEAK